MIKRDIIETVYEYDNEGKLLKKTITETHEEEPDVVTTSTYSTTPLKETLYRNDSIRGINDVISCLAKNKS